MTDKEFKSWFKNQLRKISKYWSEKTIVYHRTKVSPGKYRCESCQEVFKQKDLQIDHIEPVIDVEVGFVDWNVYIERLFCTADKMQGLCKPCHQTKSSLENTIRREVKKATLKKKKS